MTALSKVLVVLLLILSVAFAASQVILNARRADYAAKYVDAAKKLANTAEQRNEAQRALNDVTDKLEKTKSDLEGQVQALSDSLANERAQSADLERDRESLTLSVRDLTDAVNRADGNIAVREETIKELQSTIQQRDANLKQHLTSIETLERTVADREATIGKLEHDITEGQKAYKELAESEERLQAIMAELVRRKVQVPPVPLPLINGRIVRIDMEHEAAVVDKGSAAGVKPNTEFTIYNDEGYVARLVIHDVQQDISVGRIRLLADGKEIRQGDKVTTEIP
ncbi:MAG: hypothetical protein ACYTFZ_05540 [Planctomycetota bacterium]|jgi:septal ring factor EnvC (AmiA/AmiB activator)